MKSEVVERLGEKAVLLPSLIGTALAANDRIKLGLSLLQEAGAQAQNPNRKPNLFEPERRAANLDFPGIDSMIASARALSPTRLYIPGVHQLLAGMTDDLSHMLAPLNVEDSETAHALSSRLEHVRKTIPAAQDDQLDIGDIEALSSAARTERDGVHVLVMDMHKALNRLAADTAPENLDGARVHGLNDSDRSRVSAFMRGLSRTAPLAFGHPGLGTTAVRANQRLIIQNDIGTTDAHVLVVHVEDSGVTVTYTDVHRPRAKFFMSLFDGKGVTWSPLSEQSGEGFSEDVFYLVTARYASEKESEIDAFLEFLGSRIVFLIDWNKARKAIQTFVGKNAAIDLLTWAAIHDYGHRGFLALGGVDLVLEAVHRAAAGRIPYGVRLDEALGAAECARFLKGVLQDTSQGLAAGRTPRLIRDEIQTDLSRRFETVESSVFTVLVRHLGLSRTLAGAIAEIISAASPASRAERQRLAQRAKLLEAKADRLTVIAREITARVHEPGMLRAITDEIENAADSLEDCAFLMTLVPDADVGTISTEPFVRLSQVTTDSVGQMVRAVEMASRLPKGKRLDAVALLHAIDAVVNHERNADAAERDTLVALMSVPRSDARALVVGREIVRMLETATDHLSHAALLLRDHLLAELSA